MVLDQISKAAGKNHGVTLQPLAVQELMEFLSQIRMQGAVVTHRLDVATQVIEAILQRGGEEIVLDATELEAANTGFWMRHDKVENTIRIGLGEPPESEVIDADYEAAGIPVEMQEMPGDSGDVRESHLDQPPLPLDFDGTGERIEGSSDEAGES